MNIVYGVSGEGLGHVFEEIQITKRLLREGHTVKVLTYGNRAVEALAAFAPTRIAGITLHFNDEGMSVGKTVSRNLGIIPFYLRNGASLMRELKAFNPDAFVTAYEPFTTVAAHLMHRPLISMDNQNELLYVEAPPGGDRFAFGLARLATRICTHGAAHYIIKTYAKPALSKEGVHFVAPVIQSEIRSVVPAYGDHVLVYLTKPNPDLIGVLKAIDEKFIVYCNNAVGQEGNVTHRAKGPSFLEDLASCKAIIGTTGFSLIADSIYLKKPYFGVPLKKQFEQTYNAQYLVRAGFGEYSEAPTRAQIESFLANLPAFRERLAGNLFNPAEQEETLLRLLQTVDRRSRSL
jgi:uncharacterized protein (TIGR00661 family)